MSYRDESQPVEVILEGIEGRRKQLALRKVWEGRMGTNLTPNFEILIDGEISGFSKRKWLAKAIGMAIIQGDIQNSGDTTMRWVQWASKYDVANYERMGDDWS